MEWGGCAPGRPHCTPHEGRRGSGGQTLLSSSHIEGFMDDNYFYMQESNKHIIILCPNCGQKIRLPIVRSTLEVFCKICRNSFPYEYGEGFSRGRVFQFIVPHELIVFYISLAWLVMGGIASLFHAYLPSGTREREFMVFFLMTLCVALVLCISSGIRIFLDVKGIPRILRLGKVICSRYGIL